MLHDINWMAVRARYEQYWQRKNRRPIMYLEAPRDGARWYEETVSSNDYWFNADYLVRSARHNLAQSAYALDGYPHVMTSLGPDLMAGVLGWDLKYNDNGEWVVHRDVSMEELARLSVHKDGFLYRKMEEILTKFTEDAKQGDYIVGLVDLNTLLDGIAALIGPQNLFFAMQDEPEALLHAMARHLALFKGVYTHFDSIARRYQGGSTNWLSVYSDTPWYFISLDVIVMISDRAFLQFVEQPLRDMCAFLGRNLFHLDGENAARHLDRLLALPEITGIQVQCTPQMEEPVKFWVPHLKRILQAGKTAWIYAQKPEEIQLLMDQLPPEGLYIKTWCETEKDMDLLQRRVLDFYGETE